MPTTDLPRSLPKGVYRDAYPALELRVAPARCPRAASNTDKIRHTLTRYLDGLGTLGLDDPAGIGPLLDRARELWAELSTPPAGVDPATVKAELIAGLAADSLDLATIDARLRQLRLDGADADQHRKDRANIVSAAVAAVYDNAQRAVIAHAADVVAALDTVVADAVSKQARVKTGHVDPTLEQRYETAHTIAAGLRGWALDNVPAAFPIDPWRYRRPDLVWHWKLGRLGSVATGHATAIGAGNTRDGNIVPLYRRPHGVPVTLADLAAHPEWEPAIVTAAQLVEINQRVGEALSPDAA